MIRLFSILWTNRKMRQMDYTITYPNAPLEKACNSRFNVDLTLFSEYRPSGELNCLWTTFRCTVAISILSFRFLHQSFSGETKKIKK